MSQLAHAPARSGNTDCPFRRRRTLSYFASSEPATRFAEHYPLQIRPLGAELPPLRVGLHWIWRVHDDPAHRWLRECFTRLFAQPRRR